MQLKIQGTFFIRLVPGSFFNLKLMTTCTKFSAFFLYPHCSVLQSCRHWAWRDRNAHIEQVFAWGHPDNQMFRWLPTHVGQYTLPIPTHSLWWEWILGCIRRNWCATDMWRYLIDFIVEYPIVTIDVHLYLRVPQIILLSGTSKNYEGQVNPPGTCPGDKCHKIRSMSPISCNYQILLWQRLLTSMKMFRQVNLWVTCPSDKWKFSIILSLVSALCAFGDLVI